MKKYLILIGKNRPVSNRKIDPFIDCSLIRHTLPCDLSNIFIQSKSFSSYDGTKLDDISRCGRYMGLVINVF